jgi:hypothetical protein
MNRLWKFFSFRFQTRISGAGGRWQGSPLGLASKFTCRTSTKVQVLTPEELRDRALHLKWPGKPQPDTVVASGLMHLCLKAYTQERQHRGNRSVHKEREKEVMASAPACHLRLIFCTSTRRLASAWVYCQSEQGIHFARTLGLYARQHVR